MNPLHRIIDANTNRASEGIRVLEDLARFSFNDHPLSSKLKDARHQLRSAIDELNIPRDQLLISRDTPGDVGTTISTTQEHNRSEGIVDLIAAASKRSQESLRVLEETSKALPPSNTPTIYESIRYSIYDIERSLTLKASRPSPHWKVCVLVTKELCTHHPIERVIQDIAKAEIPCIQIREKDMPGTELYSHCKHITSLAHDLGLTVIINDRVDIALAVNADGVHLGQSDLPIEIARSILGPTTLIGRSCSSVELINEAFDQGADYCGLGPIFPSTTKAKPDLSGLESIQSAIDHGLQDHPLLAISGINTTNAKQIADLGFPGIAVSSAVCSAEDPYKVAMELMDLMS